MAVKRLVVTVGLAMACGGVSEPPARSGPTATVWVHRRLVVGRARANASVDELRLEIDGDRATLVVSEKRAAQTGLDVQPSNLPFREIRRTTLRGTATRSANALDLALSNEANDAGATRMHCTLERRRVAAADAVRVRDPSYQSECGDRGVWRPSATVVTDALVCVSADAVAGADAREVAFGRAPGIELLGISEGCFLQGEAERLVPADGSLAPAVARTPAPQGR
jgi:hypothetical protein